MSVSGSVMTAQAAGPGEGELHQHLVRLPGTDWNMWRTVVVRGAGFPAAIMEDLAANRAAAAADRYLAQRARAVEMSDAALRRKGAELQGSFRSRSQLSSIRAAIEAGKAGELADSDAAEAAAAFAEAFRFRQEFLSAFRADEEAVSERLVELCHDSLFHEAMLWQNLASTRRVCHDLRLEARGVRRRASLRHIAMRAQRYCLKNDSIGFFGPVGWATIQESGNRIQVDPGAALIAHRQVFFEGWTIDILASCLDSEELRPWVAPRIKAGVWIHESRAYRPQRKEHHLTEAETVVLARCDGMTTAREIAQALIARRSAGLLNEQEVFNVLEKLVAAGVIAWRLEVASQQYPECELEERLARIGDAGLRERCRASLSELLSARDRVAAAAGNHAGLDPALSALDATFTRLTNQPSSRRGGQAYAGRTLVYEDCRRDGEIHIGTSFLEDLAQPLGIVFDASRWGVAEIGRVMKAQLRKCLAELRERKAGEIDCHTFSEYVMSTVWNPEKPCTLFEPAIERFREVWDCVLGGPVQSSEGRVAFPVEEVRARASMMFPARDAGWSLARYISPDLMIAASSVEAIRQGDYAGVLGEVHCGNSMATFLYQHHEPQHLLDATEADTRNETVVIRQRPKAIWIARTNNVFVLPHHWRYLYGEDPASDPPCRTLPAGMLVVNGTEDSVRVRARDGSIEFDALELFGGLLVDEASHMMGEFRTRLPRMPRMTLGKLVMARERWNLTPADMPFLSQSDSEQQFLDIRLWARALGMPRRVFVSSPNERKPWFLDFDSPVSITIFVALMKKLPAEANVAVSEMLPDLNDLWLVDRNGRRYTSELRMVARPAAVR